MNAISVDRFDIQLLEELQRNGHATNSELGEKIHLSASQVSRRVQRLQEGGVLDHYAAILDPLAVGLDVMVFTLISMEDHNDAAIRKFEREIKKLPQVLECFSLTGEADYMLRIVAPDLASFAEFMSRHLQSMPGVTNVRSSVTLQRVKQTHVLPLEHVMQPVESKKRIKYAP
jgi:Lrp/AsnC family transcriptional regulator, leucine-responsive regulatory protein